MCRTCAETLWKGKWLSNGKGIVGAGRLTDKAINTLTILLWKISVWATLFHNCDIANEEEDINFALTYVQVDVCGGQINLLLAKINTGRNIFTIGH